MTIKELTQNIIQSLNDNCSIEKIMLQAQTIAYYLEDDRFNAWLYNEQHGYGKNTQIPQYRLLECRVKLNLVDANAKIHDDFDFIVGNLKDEEWEQFFYNIDIRKSLPELEKYVDNGEKLKQPISAELYPIIEDKLLNAVIQSANKEVLPANMASIISTVKAKLLAFFLKLNDELKMNVDFTKTENKNHIVNIMKKTIYAGVVNTGNGSVSINSSEITVGQGNITYTTDLTKDLSVLIEELKKIKIDKPEEKQDLLEGVKTLQKEVNTSEPNVGIIRRTIRMLKSIPSIIAAHGIEICMDNVLQHLSETIL